MCLCVSRGFVLSGTQAASGTNGGMPWGLHRVLQEKVPWVLGFRPFYPFVLCDRLQSLPCLWCGYGLNPVSSACQQPLVALLLLHLVVRRDLPTKFTWLDSPDACLLDLCSFMCLFTA